MPKDADPEKYLEGRVRQLGLPTEPEAYQDGGLAIAEVAPDLQQAEMIAALLRGADIPVWVEGGHTVAWNWHMQLALHPCGIRILVPQGRLDDARAALREAKQDGAQYRAEEPAEDTASDPGYSCYRSAQRLAYLLLIYCLAPVVFVLAICLAVRIARQWRETGPTRDLVRALRLALIVGLLSLPALAAGVGIGAFVLAYGG